MRALLIIFMITIAGCSTSPVTQIGETLSVKTRVALGGKQGALDEAVKAAMDHCAVNDKMVWFKQYSTNECALRGGCGEAQFYFVCRAQGNLNDMRGADHIIEIRQR